MDLRPYQRQSIDAVNDYMRAHDDNPALVLPTGAGKSVVMATMIHEYLTAWPGTRIAVVAHVKELVWQNADKLAKVWPQAPLGIYSASLRQRNTTAPVIFASIQSVHKRAADFGSFDLVFVDEAHRIPLSGEGMYRRFIDDARAACDHLRVIGFTATPYRLGPGSVVGPEYILNSIAHEVGVRELIEQGYLCRLTSKAGEARADLADVQTSKGEYVADQLERAVNAGDLVERACEEIIERCRDRRAWLIFCAGVEHAMHVSEVLGTHGIECPVVHAQTPHTERDRIVDRYQRGELRAIANVNVLSEGFDAPHVDAVIMLRPTKSAGLYYQQVGRGLRLHPDKADCLVLDFAGNIADHGPIDTIRVREKRARGESATVGEPVRTCPDCGEIVSVRKAVCPACGYAWPTKPAHEDKPSERPILSAQIVHWQVDDVRYNYYVGRSGVPLLKVTYHCGINRATDWVCLEHEGFARNKACAWWAWRFEHLPEPPPPPTLVDDALKIVHRAGIKEPISIQVKLDGKYPDIIGYEWRDYHERGASEDTRRAGVPAHAGGGD